jgi:hypothetical protein
MVSKDPECLKLWQPMVDCYLALPDEALCPRMVGVHDGSQSPCRAQSVSYYDCAYAGRGLVGR